MGEEKKDCADGSCSIHVNNGVSEHVAREPVVPEAPVAVRKRDGKLENYNLTSIEKAIEAGVRDVGGTDFELTKSLARDFSRELARRKKIIPTRYIAETLPEFLKERGYDGTGWAVAIRAKHKERAKGNIGVLGSSTGKNSTDSFLMVGSSSKETASGWSRERIISSLINEAELDLDTASSVAEEAETYIFSSHIPQITTQLIREAVHTELIRRNLSESANKYKSFGIPRADLEQIMQDRIKENSNVNNNNPEAISFGTAGFIQKAWALSGAVFTSDVAEAHSSGAVHLHDLDMPTRVYCSAHSVEYIKKYGLKLPTSSSISGPAKHEEVLTGHLNTFLATMQAFYAGALGIGDINVFFAPHLLKDLQREGNKRVSALKERLERDKDRASKLRVGGKGNAALEDMIRDEEKSIEEFEKDPIKALTYEDTQKFYEQAAQRLIFNGSQNAFSRGGQTLFLDFNIHPDVPEHLRKTPIILDGKYQLRTSDGELIALEERKLEQKTRRGYHLIELVDPRDGSVVLTEKVKMQGKKEHLEQEITTKAGESLAKYGDPEYRTAAREFTKALLRKFGEGDFRGAPFAFPKCDFHVNEESLTNPELKETNDLAYEVASKNGAVYFVMDRDAVTMSACCRLRTTIDDDYVLKHPEAMRFCGFQNVTVNLPQASYRAARKGKKNIEGVLEEIDWAMEIAAKAHLQKKAKIKQFQQPGGPQHALGQPSLDGLPYVKLEDCTYIIGEVGVNETVQFLTGKQLHELTPQEYKDYALRIIAHMNVKAKELSERYKLKFSIEESPAESAAKRLATMDVLRFPESKQYVRGDHEKGIYYYTNSNHLPANAPVDLITRIKAQGMFHPAIDSGAITHSFVGEERPSAGAIKSLVENTFYKTQTAQLTISPEFTVCEKCNKTHAGLKDACPSCGSKEIYGMSRIVGYYSKIHEQGNPAWIDSKIEELKARHEGDYSVANPARGQMEQMELPALSGSQGEYQFVAHRAGKPECEACKRLGGEIDKVIAEYEKRGIKIKHEYHDVYTDLGMTEFLVSGLNPSRIPGVIIMNNGQEVYRHSVDWGAEGRKFTDAKTMTEALDSYLAAHASK